MFRVFKRKTWQANSEWPNGFEPLAVPQDRCRTIVTCPTREEAREYCVERNATFMKDWDAVNDGTATDAQIKHYHLADRYEFDKVRP